MTDKQITLPHAKTMVFASFKLRETGLEPIGNPTFEEWLQCGQFIKQAKGAVHFWVGDWLNYGEMRWGETYRQAVELTGFETQTLYNDKWISSRIPPERRQEALSFDHHQQVANMDAEEQEEVLAVAVKKKMTVRDFRNYLNQMQMKQAPEKKVSGHPETSPLIKALESGGLFLKDLQRLSGSVLTYDEHSQLSDLLQEIGDATEYITYENTDGEN